MTVTPRMTQAMKESLELRLIDLDERVEVLERQRTGDDSVEATALLVQLSRERAQIAEALRDATIIDGGPFDEGAIEVGDVVTIANDDGSKDSYVLVDDGVGARPRSDWVSVRSPLGSALVGRGKGERVEVAAPQGVTSFVVVDFRRASDVRDGLPPEAYVG